jgi:hypothetical protein
LISNFIPAAFAAVAILLMISVRFGIVSVYCRLDKLVNQGLDKWKPRRMDRELHASPKRALFLMAPPITAGATFECRADSAESPRGVRHFAAAAGRRAGGSSFRLFA